MAASETVRTTGRSLALDHADIVESATAELSRALSMLRDEIRGYPTPISGCDQQYIHLLSERRRIEEALKALRARPFVATPRMLEPDAARQA
jgi:hypothetical protein